MTIPPSAQSLRIEPLASVHDRAAFSCGKESLDRYIAQQAGQDFSRRAGVTYVLVGDSPNQILGYYTLAATSILVDDLPTDLSSELRKHLPRYPAIPAALLGRLAVSKEKQRQGMGAILLIDGLRRCNDLSTTALGVAAVVVDPLDDDAWSFYRKFEFIGLRSTRRMFLPMRTIAKLFGGTQTTAEKR